MHVIVTAKHAIAIGLHVDQSCRQHSFAEGKGTNPLFLSIFGRGKQRFRENDRPVLASDPFDLLQDRRSHRLIAATENHVEGHNFCAEIGGLPDDIGRVLIFQLEGRDLPQVYLSNIDMNDARVSRRREVFLVTPPQDLPEPAHLERFEWIARDQDPAGRKAKQIARSKGHGDLSQICSPAGLVLADLPGIIFFPRRRWIKSPRPGGQRRS